MFYDDLDSSLHTQSWRAAFALDCCLVWTLLKNQKEHFLIKVLD